MIRKKRRKGPAGGKAIEAVALPFALYPFLLRSGVRLLSGRRRRGVAAARRRQRRRRLHQPAIDQYLDLDATIRLASRARSVISDSIRLAVAVRRDDASQRNLVILNEVANDGIGALLAQATILLDAAGRIGKAGNFDDEALGALRLFGDSIKLSFSGGREHGAVDAEIDRHRVLHDVIVERRDAFVGRVDASNRSIGRVLSGLGSTARRVRNCRQLIYLAREALRVLLHLSDARFHRVHTRFDGARNPQIGFVEPDLLGDKLSALVAPALAFEMEAAQDVGRAVVRTAA